MRVGVLGGTFDPLHLAHVAIAAGALAHLDLDEVRLVPCRRPPHKERTDLTPGADRLAMIALGTQDHPRLLPSSVELTRPAPSYTIDTLRVLNAEEPEHRFYFIMGMDSFREIGSWKEYETLLREHHLVVVGRPAQADPENTAELPIEARHRLVESATDRDTPDGRVHLLDVTPPAVSATVIRARARRGERLDDLVPVAVASYIHKCMLYR